MPAHRRASRGGADVLVEPEAVVRVVGGLDARQAGVVGAVAVAHGGVALLEQPREVEVRLAVGERHRGVPEARACTRCCPRRRPASSQVESMLSIHSELRSPNAVSSGADAGDRAAAVADDDERVVRRAPLRPVDGGVDRGVGEARRGRAPSSSGARPPGRTGRASAGSRGTPSARSCPAAAWPARAGAASRARPRPGRPPTCPTTPAYGRPRSGSGSSSMTGSDQMKPGGGQLVRRAGDGVAPAGRARARRPRAGRRR